MYSLHIQIVDVVDFFVLNLIIHLIQNINLNIQNYVIFQISLMINQIITK
jgi:hypothetical protein